MNLDRVRGDLPWRVQGWRDSYAKIAQRCDRLWLRLAGRRGDVIYEIYAHPGARVPVLNMFVTRGALQCAGHYYYRAKNDTLALFSVRLENGDLSAYIDYGLQPIDDIPWEIHQISDPKARTAAKRAYLEAAL